MGRAGRIWGGPKLDFRDFFLPARKSHGKKVRPKKNSGFGADEIWQKVRKVKEGSNYFRGREKKKRANVARKN